IREIGKRARQLNVEISRAFTEHVEPDLKEAGVRFFEIDELDNTQRAHVHEYYRREVHPCLTPIAIDPAHPFPLLKNNSLNLALRIEQEKKDDKKSAGIGLGHPEGELLAIVQVPAVLPRFLPLSNNPSDYRFMALEHAIAMHAAELFPGHRILEARPFRV